MEADRYGLPLSTASREAAAAYREGIDLLLSGYPGAEEKFQEALRHDEGFALAYAGMARHQQYYGRVAEARASMARAKALSSNTSRREKAHVEILGLLIDGQPGKALEALLHQLEEFPNDWWFLTHLGWSHTEAGKLGAGLRITQRALELRRENAHGAHAMAHFFAEADEGEDGTEFLDGWLPDYERSAVLYSHLNWHRALWKLAEGDIDEALEVYAKTIRPAQTTAPPLIALSDAASLLWRVSLISEIPLNWSEVHAYATERFPGLAPHFVEWHRAMAAAGSGAQRAVLPETLEAARRRLRCCS